MPPPLRFIVLASARTGSTHLLDLLASHPAVRTFGEPFNLDSLPRKDADRALSDPLAYLQAALHPDVPGDVRAIGFKLFYHHATPRTFDPRASSPHLANAAPALRARIRDFLEHAASRFDLERVAADMQAVWRRIAEDRELRILHLKRANLLRVHLSLAQAYRSDRWRRSRRDAEAPPPRPIRLDPDECEAAFTNIRRNEREFDERFADHPVALVRYEELAADPAAVARDLFGFLGLETLEVSSKLLRQERRPLRDAIANYDELENRFVGGPWSEFFD